MELIDTADWAIASTVMHARGAASGASVDDAYVVVCKFQARLSPSVHAGLSSLWNVIFIAPFI